MAETIYERTRKGMSPQVSGMGGGSLAINWKPEEPQSKLGRIVNLYQQYRSGQQEAEKQRMEKLKKQYDAYQTLREAGYGPKAAWDASTSGKFPSEPGGMGIEFAKDSAEVDLTKAKTEYYKSKSMDAESGGGFTPNQRRTQRIDKQNAIAQIESGKKWDQYSGNVDVQDYSEMESYVRAKFKNVDMNDPDIQAALAKKYPQYRDQKIRRKIAEMRNRGLNDQQIRVAMQKSSVLTDAEKAKIDSYFKG